MSEQARHNFTPNQARHNFTPNQARHPTDCYSPPVAPQPASRQRSYLEANMDLTAQSAVKSIFAATFDYTAHDRLRRGLSSC